MLLRKHPFSFLRPLFLYRSYKSKEPPLRVALLIFSSRDEPRQVQEVRRADAHPQGEAGACSSRAFEGAASFQKRQCPCRKRIIGTAADGATSGAVGGLSDGR